MTVRCYYEYVSDRTYKYVKEVKTPTIISFRPPNDILRWVTRKLNRKGVRLNASWFYCRIFRKGMEAEKRAKRENGRQPKSTLALRQTFIAGIRAGKEGK